MSRLRKKVTCLLVVSLVLLIAMDVSARTFTLKNSSGATRTIRYLPGGNSWSIANGSSVNFSVADGTAAMRFWADYGIQSPPCNSLAEFTLNGAGNQDFYDVSFVDGYNLAVLIQPSGGTGSLCIAPGKLTAINCPAELQKSGSCCSACMVFNTDQYCCRGAYGLPTTCPPTSYSLIFHNYCPNCYSYAYDDTAATFICSNNPSYTITWGSPMSGSATTTTASSTTSTASSTTSTASSTTSTATSTSTTASSTSTTASSTSTTATGTINVPGTVTTNVGAIASGVTKTWNVNKTVNGNYRVLPTFAGGGLGQQVVITFNGTAVTISANSGQTPPVDYGYRTTGTTTLTIKANTTNVNIGNLSVTTY